MRDILDINRLKEVLKKFAQDRDWESFHNPKNICMALTSEVGELSEIFQWLTAEEATALEHNCSKLNEIKEEIADIMIYAILMSSVLKINVEQALLDKMKKNGEKYPAHLVKGSAKKYNEYS